MRQVITIDQNGIMSGLQTKPGKGVDLRQFGTASIKRASDIEWDEDAQAWTIRLLSTAHKGEQVTYRMLGLTLSLEDLAEQLPVMLPDAGVVDQPARWADYDQAVSAEIAYFNALRLRDGAEACT